MCVDTQRRRQHCRDQREAIGRAGHITVREPPDVETAAGQQPSCVTVGCSGWTDPARRERLEMPAVHDG